MSEQRQKKRNFLSTLFRPLRNRPPLPRPSGDTSLLSEAPTSPQPLPGSSLFLPLIDQSQSLNDRHNQRPDKDTPNPQSSIFSNIEHVHIGVANITQIINNRDDNIFKNVIFQSLPRSCDAAFSAAINLDNFARRPCTKGTRIDIIAQITAWTNEKDPAKAPPVYWLTGLAGLGKTTIAYTICESLNEAHLPFASFFCSLQLDSWNSKLLVTTLCRDLAELDSSYAANLLQILETNSKVVNARLSIQINELLVKPWQASTAQRYVPPTPIVVVDALDECDRGTEFLEELLRVIQAGELAGIKFLVTSRPEPKIVNMCKSFPPNAVCKLHEVDTSNVQNDIELYLREALPELKDEPELRLLSQRAGGLFIYATTAVRFISPPRSPSSAFEMRSYLRAMLDDDALTSHADSDDRLLVDELYERILVAAFRDAKARTVRLPILHTIMCAQSRINMSVLADLTNVDEDTVKRVVESLHAVLFVSPNDGCVYWYHASFLDFVFSQTRARINVSNRLTDVFCDGPSHHGFLSRRCFSIMQECLHFNMCGLPSSYVFDHDVIGLDSSIQRTFTPSVRYVARHWARHLLRAVAAKNGGDLVCDLKDFLCDKLLFWIEAMNLIGAKGECSSLLQDAKSWLKLGVGWTELLEQLEDAINFSAFFAGSPASKSTPHLYVSTLSMWHQDSAIWTNWNARFGYIPSISMPETPITIPLLTIPTSLINSVAFSPDGNRIVTGSAYYFVHVWDAKTGEQQRELRGHTEYVTSVAFSTDGKRIVSGSKDKSVRVWDANTGEQLRELRGHTEHITSVSFSSDGNRIVSGSWDESVRVWDGQTGGQLMELRGHSSCVASVSFSSDGSRVVSGSWDKSIRVWDAKTGKQLRELQGHTDFVSSVLFSSDGNRIVSGSEDSSVRVWDARTGEQLRELRGHTDKVISVSFSSDGTRIVSGSDDKSVRVWDAKTGKLLRELRGHTGAVTSVSFSSDGNRIVSGASDTVQVWDGKMADQNRDLQGHTSEITSVSFSSDGNRIVSGSKDRSVRIWDAKTGEQVRELQGHTKAVQSVAFSFDGSRIVSGSWDDSVRVWDSNTGKQLMELRGHPSYVNSVSFSSDGIQILSGSTDKSVRIWDAKTGEQLREFRGHTSSVKSASFSSDGNRVVSSPGDKSVRVWDAKTGEPLMETGGDPESVYSVSFSSDGTRILAAGRAVRVWDARTGEQLRELQGHANFVPSASFSPDGNRIVTGSWDHSVRIWDAKTGEQLRELQGHTNYVNSVSFSSDGTRIVSGSDDNSVRVWSNLNLDSSWVIDDDGWIFSGADRLVWVPSTICNVLLRPHNTLIISRNGSATISFDECKLGTVWHDCYTPHCCTNPRKLSFQP